MSPLATYLHHIGRMIVVADNVRLLGGPMFRDDLDMRLVAGPRRRRRQRPIGRCLIKGARNDVAAGVVQAQIEIAVRIVVVDENFPQRWRSHAAAGSMMNAGLGDIRLMVAGVAVHAEVVVVWHVQVEGQWWIAVLRDLRDGREAHGN